jgi:uncharacterized protein YdeI (YjbR/CyaY-like superfamily)
MHALAELELEVDPPRLVVPPELADALDRDVVARRAFERLPLRSQQHYVWLIQDAAGAAARRRMAARTLTLLRAAR